jgi:hypothetical protein
MTAVRSYYWHHKIAVNKKKSRGFKFENVSAISKMEKNQYWHL